jgi:hypothetical protein
VTDAWADVRRISLGGSAVASRRERDDIWRSRRTVPVNETVKLERY